MRKLLMSWVPATRRWAKFYRGRSYAVSCAQLNCPETKEASWRAANNWWTAKQTQLDAANPPKPKAHPHQAEINTASERVEWAKVNAPAEVSELKAVLDTTVKMKTVEPYAEPPEADVKEVARTIAEFERLTGVQLPDDIEFETLQRYFGRAKVWEDRLQTRPVTQVNTNNTIRTAADEYLALQKKKKPGTYSDTYTHINQFLAFTTDNLPIASINEDLWRRFYLSLALKVERDELSSTTCHNRQVGARAFINYLYEQGRLPALPRNLTSTDLMFKVGINAVDVPDLDTTVRMIAAAPGALKLYLMLMINTGMQQSDIADLTPFQVDWDGGTITRKRVKTISRKSSPTVTYKLWAPTLALLNEHNSGRNDLVLVTSRGTPLVERTTAANGKPKKKDMIQTQFWRWNSAGGAKRFDVELKQLRKLSPSLLEKNTEFSRYSQYFLSQAPSGVTDKSYVQPSQDRFDAAVAWLATQYGFASA